MPGFALGLMCAETGCVGNGDTAGARDAGIGRCRTRGGEKISHPLPRGWLRHPNIIGACDFVTN
jgi:hypothetical protein